MRFLVENGTYLLDNLGDVAMLQVTVDRLLERYPTAQIKILTERPDRARFFFPRAEPLVAGPWFRLPVIPTPGRLRWTRTASRLRWWERKFQTRFPRLATLGKHLHARREPGAPGAVRHFWSALQAADAVVCCGGGLINDKFHEHAGRIIATIGAAQGLGKPTAMFGLGLGPLTHHDLVQWSTPVLRRLEVLGLREQGIGPDIARRLGIDDSRICFTGDDATELAVAAGPVHPDERIDLGINLRLAPHAEVPQEVLAGIGGILRQFAAERGARCVATPVYLGDRQKNDIEAVRELLGSEHVNLDAARACVRPADLIRTIGRCRLVVTGAYHSAVFAVAQGIPVVGLMESEYYQAKLGGVAAQYPQGVRVLLYSDPDLLSRLSQACSDLWDRSFTVDQPLREAACGNVARSRAAYERFFGHLSPPADGRTA